MVERLSIKDITLNELSKAFEGLGFKPYTAAQLVQWLYKKGATSFDEMTNISKAARVLLNEQFYISRLELVQKLESVDGTQKFAWKLGDGSVIESVLIPAATVGFSSTRLEARNHSSFELRSSSFDTSIERRETSIHNRLTMCISTQVGCAMGCTFCRTARMGFVRNLTQSEILDQVIETERLGTRHSALDARIEAGSSKLEARIDNSSFDRRASTNDTRIERRVTNVVLMGMGEPLANYDAVVGAIKVLLDTRAFGLSKRHVTLSTVGLVPAIERLAKDRPGMRLAISLNATTDEVRSKLMPINKKYPLAELMAACRAYAKACEGDRITFEYVMIAGVNDSTDDAKRLVKLLSHVPSKVNLIPFNPWKFPLHPPFLQPEADPPLAEKGGWGDFQPTGKKVIKEFANYLRKKHIQTNIRISRGQDILAACGQLASDCLRLQLTEIPMAKRGRSSDLGPRF